ncbi:MAG: replication-associated recombination protein A [Burkholderiales bacterium]|jgi:putative ATPase
MQPLADRLRPQSIQSMLGQAHLLSDQSPLGMAIKAQRAHSMILWGPPGVGKTSLARLLAQAFKCRFIALSAVFSGVKDIRESIEQARLNRDTGAQSLLFIDEIHRFNKAQQDALLPFVESGLVCFVGATTENPSFEVNAALLSRAQVYVLKPLDEQALRAMFATALERLEDAIPYQNEAIDRLIEHADGDGRRFLNVIEQTQHAAHVESLQIIDPDFLLRCLSQPLRRFDKGGDQFYDQISALHKAVRGSDPDAALYWLCRMLDGGADPRYLARRIVRMAWEDIGLADPRALQISTDAAHCFERLGSPEGELALAQATIYLAIAAKSNAGYMAFKQAHALVKKDKSRQVPMHLRNAPSALMRSLGHGDGYQYDHDHEDGFASSQSYWPDDLNAQVFYRPSKRGLEIQISEKLSNLRQLRKAKN